MAKRGRPRKSKEDKVLEGNPGNRPIEDDAPEVDVSEGTLRLPQRLCKDGRRAFTELMGAFPDWYFTKADRHLILAYCRVVARMNKAERAMLEDEMVIERANGSKCVNPHLQIIQACENQLIRLSEVLGVTRDKRVGVAGPGEDRVPEGEAELPSEEAGEFGDLIQLPVRGRIE